MSRQASAERERRSRVTLALAEVEAASKMVEASKMYVDNPGALQLRWMNILYERISSKEYLPITSLRVV